jgi:dephospho-CoA kinase
VRRFTDEVLALAADREVRYRRKVYPRLVAKGSMTQAQADERIAHMQEIAERLRQLATANPQDSGRLI